MKMKKILILIPVILIVSIVLFFAFNKTFYKKYYEITNLSNNNVKIPLPRFSYFKEYVNNSAIFYTLRSTKRTQDILNKYVENLQSCYDESYFYDKNLDITIIRYNIENEFPFNKITLNYELGNKCKDEYVLDDNWIKEMSEKAEYQDMVIERCITVGDTGKCDSKKIQKSDIETIFNYILDKNTKRIKIENNIGIEINNKYSISIYYNLNGKGYTSSIFKYNDNLAFKVIDANDHQKNAIYNINKNIDEIFNTIYRKY